MVAQNARSRGLRAGLAGAVATGVAVTLLALTACGQGQPAADTGWYAAPSSAATATPVDRPTDDLQPSQHSAPPTGSAASGTPTPGRTTAAPTPGRTTPTPTDSPTGEPPANGEMTLTGTVEAGVQLNCLVLRHDGRLYLLAGGDPAVVKPAARVTVRGTPMPEAPSFCMQGMVFRVTSAQPA